MRDERFLRKLAVCAFLTVLAAVVGLLESLLPVSFFLALPGVKLGFANVFLTAAFYLFGPRYGFFVTLARVLIGFLFGGNPISLALSLTGGMLAYLSLFLTMPQVDKRLSFVGVSALSASLHAVGQLAAASVLIGASAFGYLPILGIASVGTGTVTGLVMDLVMRPLRVFFQKRRLIT